MRIVERSLVVLMFTIMVILYGANVVVREIAPEASIYFSWNEEAARLAMIWGVCLVAGIALERGRHITMASLLNALPPGLNLWTNRLINLVGFVTCAFIAYLSAKLAYFVHARGQISPSLGISMMYLYAAPAVGFVLLGQRYLFAIFVGSNWRANPEMGDSE